MAIEKTLHTPDDRNGAPPDDQISLEERVKLPDWARHGLDGEAKNLTQYQKNCLMRAIALLDPDHPGFTGSDSVAFILKQIVATPGCVFPTGNVHSYIHSYVIPALLGALHGEIYRDHHESIREDAARVRIAIRRWWAERKPVVPAATI